MKLKRPDKRSKDVCDASRCNQRPTIGDISGAVWPDPVALCDAHFTERCEALEARRSTPPDEELLEDLEKKLEAVDTAWGAIAKGK